MVRGVSWTAVSQVLSQVSTFAATIVLARILAPKDFGVVGMAALFIGLVTIMGEIGMGAAIVQRKSISQRQLDTVFWTGLAVGILAFLFSFAAAPLAVEFFGEPMAGQVVRVTALAFVIDALGSVHQVLLSKEMRFNLLARAEIFGAVVYTVVAIGLALLGAGVWAIVIGQIVRAIAENLGMWILEPWRPRFEFSYDDFRGLFAFGARIWGFNFVNYLRENVDNFVIGRLLGSASLGFYALAYNLANLPRRQMSSIVSRVTFPAFSKAQDNDSFIREAYTKVLRYVSLITFPLLGGLAVLAPQLIPVIYGDQWIPAIVPLQLLCGVGMLYSVGSTVGSVFLAKGRPDLQFRIGLVVLCILTVIVLVSVRWGLVGVAAGVLVYAMTSWLIGQSFANRLISLRMPTYLRSLAPASIACAVMVAALGIARPFVLHSGLLGPIPWLVCAVLAGAAIYIGALAVMRIPEFAEVFGVFRKRRLRRAEEHADPKAGPWETRVQAEQGEAS